jgi:hypothetical protein
VSPVHVGMFRALRILVGADFGRYSVEQARGVVAPEGGRRGVFVAGREGGGIRRSLGGLWRMSFTTKECGTLGYALGKAGRIGWIVPGDRQTFMVDGHRSI